MSDASEGTTQVNPLPTDNMNAKTVKFVLEVLTVIGIIFGCLDVIYTYISYPLNLIVILFILFILYALAVEYRIRVLLASVNVLKKK